MSADALDVVLMKLRQENEELQRRLDESVSKELTVSILVGAKAGLENTERALRTAANEMAKSRRVISTFIAKLKPPT